MTLPDRAGRRTEQKGPRRLVRVGTLPHAGCAASSRPFPFRIRLSPVPPAGRAVARCPSDSRRALRAPPCRRFCRAYSRSIHPKMREALWNAVACCRFLSGQLAGHLPACRALGESRREQAHGIKAAASCRTPEARPLLDKPRLFGRRCQNFGAALGADQNSVLHSDPTEAFQVDPRLGSDHESSAQSRFLVAAQPGSLMDLEAHAVTGAVREVIGEASPFQRATGCPV